MLESHDRFACPWAECSIDNDGLTALVEPGLQLLDRRSTGTLAKGRVIPVRLTECGVLQRCPLGGRRQQFDQRALPWTSHGRRSSPEATRTDIQGASIEAHDRSA
ncbi:MAG TPA: hypothetical protein VGD80_14075 [Kofleriaceae bacterium]